MAWWQLTMAVEFSQSPIIKMKMKNYNATNCWIASCLGLIIEIVKTRYRNRQREKLKNSFYYSIILPKLLWKTFKQTIK